MSTYKEIFKLKEMLEKTDIKFAFYDRSWKDEYNNKKIEHYQICCPDDGCNRYLSAIEGNLTYGGNRDLIEIWGPIVWDDNNDEKNSMDVLGYQSAEDVFKRIIKYNERIKNNG